jgi:uncharacterized protein with HEPN domain
MNTTGIYQWSKTENGVRQVTPEITKPLYDVIIFNTQTNQRLIIAQMVEFFDRESFIQEIETVKTKTNNNFNSFQSDILLQRAVERDLEIIGEAIRKILELDPTISISSAKNIIGLRNIISHAYDSVEPEMIWGIIQNNIPVLADEINTLKGQ